VAAAATVLAIFEELDQETEMPPRRPGSRPNIDETGVMTPREIPDVLDESDFAHWTPKQISVRAINATLALAQTVGALTAAVATLERKLEEDYEDTKTHELRTLREAARKKRDWDKVFKGVMTAVVTAIAVAEALRWLGLPH
jgi:hypothetical protein